MYTALTKNTEFKRVYGRGRSAVRSCLVVYALPRKSGGVRLGLTAGKKVGCAPQRNRARRRLKELFRLNIESISPKYDIVIVARARAVRAQSSVLKSEFIAACREVGIWNG